LAAQRMSALLPSSTKLLPDLSTTFDALVNQADTMKLQGNLRVAADDYLRAAHTLVGNIDSERDVALEAYYAVAATNDPKKASGIRKQFDLGNQLGSDFIQLETRAIKNGAIEAKESFSNAAAINSLTNF
jgi:hypothetical protein